MTIMLAKTYAAFKAAGVPDTEAQAAAEELAGYAKIEGKVMLLIWMVGFSLTLNIGNLYLTLQILSRLPQGHS
jgi:hypothetical protein